MGVGARINEMGAARKGLVTRKGLVSSESVPGGVEIK